MGSLVLEEEPVEVGVRVSVEEVGVTVELEEDSDEGVGVGVEVLEGVGVGVSVGVSVEVLELVGVGVGVLVLDEVAVLVGTETVSELEESPLASTSKTTMLALEPGGTVMTQPVAPPAPVNMSRASMMLTAMVEGSILQGRPLQPGPSHSTSIPKLGRTLRKGVVGSK